MGSLDPQNDDYLSVLDGVLAAAIDRRELVTQKQWKIVIRGKQIVLRDATERIIRWVEKFKAVGDVLSQYDPTTIGPAWGIVRFLLQVSIYTIKSNLFVAVIV